MLVASKLEVDLTIIYKRKKQKSSEKREQLEKINKVKGVRYTPGNFILTFD